MTNFHRIDDSVKAAKRASTGTLVDGPDYLRAAYLVDDANAGQVVLRDGGASGKIIFDFDTPGGSVMEDKLLPGLGIPFRTDLHVTLTNVTGITVVYGDTS